MEQLWYNNGWIQEIVGGLITSLVTSGIYILSLIYLRPKLVISKSIAEDENGCASFKFYNNSRFELVNLKLTLHMKEVASGPKGQNYRMEEIPLKFKSIDSLAPNNAKSRNDNHVNAVQVKVPDCDFLNKWKNKHSSAKLEFKICFSHGLTGLTGVTKEYYHDYSTVVEEGNFVTGNSTEIKKRTKKS